jgi:hypothetical protein
VNGRPVQFEWDDVKAGQKPRSQDEAWNATIFAGRRPLSKGDTSALRIVSASRVDVPGSDGQFRRTI